tara:strand:- start:1387 stop:2181 length:795 start_codon:yes stop_codon:yes gene_type:complete
MHKLFKISGNTQNFPEFEQFHKLSTEFLPFAQKKLGFDKPISVNLMSDPQNAKDPLGKTAYYEPEKMKITLFVDKRHVKDILRSMAHELVHHTQNCRGEFKNGIHAGEGYAQEDGHMREMEREAYEKGQLILRDWEDGRKKSMTDQIQRENKVMKEGMTHEGNCQAAHKDLEHSEWEAKQSEEESAVLEEDEAEDVAELEESASEKKKVWKNPDGESGTVICEPGPCTEKAAGDKIRSKQKNENWLKGRKDELLFERLIKKWTK